MSIDWLRSRNEIHAAVDDMYIEMYRLKNELADLCQRCGHREEDDGQGPQWESEIGRILEGPE